MNHRGCLCLHLLVKGKAGFFFRSSSNTPGSRCSYTKLSVSGAMTRSPRPPFRCGGPDQPPAGISLVEGIRGGLGPGLEFLDNVLFRDGHQGALCPDVPIAHHFIDQGDEVEDGQSPLNVSHSRPGEQPFLPCVSTCRIQWAMNHTVFWVTPISRCSFNARHAFEAGHGEGDGERPLLQHPL